MNYLLHVGVVFDDDTWREHPTTPFDVTTR